MILSYWYSTSKKFRTQFARKKNNNKKSRPSQIRKTKAKKLLKKEKVLVVKRNWHQVTQSNFLKEKLQSYTKIAIWHFAISLNLWFAQFLDSKINVLKLLHSLAKADILVNLTLYSKSERSRAEKQNKIRALPKMDIFSGGWQSFSNFYQKTLNIVKNSNRDFQAIIRFLRS